jgi:hypothetical protein
MGAARGVEALLPRRLPPRRRRSGRSCRPRARAVRVYHHAVAASPSAAHRPHADARAAPAAAGPFARSIEAPRRLRRRQGLAPLPSTAGVASGGEPRRRQPVVAPARHRGRGRRADGLAIDGQGTACVALRGAGAVARVSAGASWQPTRGPEPVAVAIAPRRLVTRAVVNVVALFDPPATPTAAALMSRSSRWRRPGGQQGRRRQRDGARRSGRRVAGRDDDQLLVLSWPPWWRPTPCRVNAMIADPAGGVCLTRVPSWIGLTASPAADQRLLSDRLARALGGLGRTARDRHAACRSEQEHNVRRSSAAAGPCAVATGLARRCGLPAGLDHWPGLLGSTATGAKPMARTRGPCAGAPARRRDAPVAGTGARGRTVVKADLGGRRWPFMRPAAGSSCRPLLVYGPGLAGNQAAA